MVLPSLGRYRFSKLQRCGVPGGGGRLSLSLSLSLTDLISQRSVRTTVNARSSSFFLRTIGGQDAGCMAKVDMTERSWV